MTLLSPIRLNLSVGTLPPLLPLCVSTLGVSRSVNFSKYFPLHSQALVAEEHSQNLCITVSIEPMRHTWQHLSTAAFVLPLQKLTATGQCQTNHRRPASFSVRWLSHTFNHLNLYALGSTPANFNVTASGTLFFYCRSCLPNCVE